MIATATVLAMSTAVYAEAPSVLGYAEYAVEAEQFEFGLGTQLIIAEGVTVTPMVIGTDASGAFELESAEVSIRYGLSNGAYLYTVLETDADFGYAETTVGVSFNF